MRVFYDLEFLENGKRIWLISVALKREAGGLDSEYYAVNAAIGQGRLYERIRRHDWLMDNVIPRLPGTKVFPRGILGGGQRSFRLSLVDTRVKPLWVIANEVRDFLNPGPNGERVELWADCGAYDHVRLMQLWGPMVNKPSFLPFWTRDIQQYGEHLGIDPEEVDVEIPTEGSPHDALYDARVLASQWRALRTIEIRREGLMPSVLSTGELVGRSFGPSEPLMPKADYA